MDAKALRQHRKWMADLRKKRGLSQAEVAKKLHISQQFYSSIETGQKKGAGDIGLRIARFYGVPLEWMYNDSAYRVTDLDEERAVAAD